MEVIKGSVVVKVSDTELKALDKARDLLDGLMSLKVDLEDMEGYNSYILDDLLTKNDSLDRLYDELGYLYNKLSSNKGILEIKPEY